MTKIYFFFFFQIASSLAVCISFFILGNVIGFPTIALPVLTKEHVASSNNDTSLLSQTVFLNEDEASAFVYMYPLIGSVTLVVGQKEAELINCTVRPAL